MTSSSTLPGPDPGPGAAAEPDLPQPPRAVPQHAGLADRSHTPAAGGRASAKPLAHARSRPSRAANGTLVGAADATSTELRLVGRRAELARVERMLDEDR